MIEEWKSVKGIDRKTDDALWKRFSRARETFARRRGAHFAELDRARTAGLVGGWQWHRVQWVEWVQRRLLRRRWRRWRRGIVVSRATTPLVVE